MEAQLEQGRWPLAEVARHWLAAGDGDAHKALRYAVLAGDEAAGKLAPDEARRWYQISLELLGRQRDPDVGEVCELMLRRGEAERQSGHRCFRETLLEAAELAQRIGDEGRLVRAALANSRGMQSETGVVDEARIATLDAALNVVPSGDSPERARLLAMQAAELMYSGEWDRRTRLSDEAVAIARRLNAPDALSTVLNMRFVTLLAPHSHGERCAETVEAVAAAQRLSDPIAQFFAYHWRGYALIEDGDIAAARVWMQRERDIAERFRLPTALWLAGAGEANLAIIAGKLDVAARLAEGAFDLGRHSEPDALVCYAAQRTSIAFESGRLPEMIPALEQAAEANPGVPGFRATLALALIEALRMDEAREILEREAGGIAEMPRDVAWLTVTCIYAYVSVRLECVPALGTLYDLLEPWAEQIAFPAFGVWGPVAFYLGSLALALEEFDQAERHLTYAGLAASRAGAPIWAERVAGQLARLGAITG
jgi:tetratricopeptide (TPR) repeat protein